MTARFPILLVDDDPHLGEVLQRAALATFPEARFISVTTFGQAVAYLDSLTGNGPRLILLDLDLQSDSTGFDFLILLRQHPQGRLVPVIILSADRRQEQAEQAYRLGANVYTPKPFSFQDWKTYTQRLRAYWFETATVPQLWFERPPDGDGG